MTLSAEAWKALDIGPFWTLRHRPTPSEATPVRAGPVGSPVSSRAPESPSLGLPVEIRGWLMSWHGLLRRRLGQPVGLSCTEVGGVWILRLTGIGPGEGARDLALEGGNDLERRRSANELYLRLTSPRR